MELPRQRKQTSRYTYNDGEMEGMSELETSGDSADSDNGGASGVGRGRGRGFNSGRGKFTTLINNI